MIMKQKKINVALVSTVVLAVVIAAVVNPSLGQGTAAAPSLEGAWKVDITFLSGPGPVGETVPGGNYITYNRGGGFVTTAPGFAPPTPFTFSIGHGNWERALDHEFAASWVTQIHVNGIYSATLKVNDRISLNQAGNEFHGRRSIQAFDLAGNPVPGSDGCSTIHGTRVVIEPVAESCP